MPTDLELLDAWIEGDREAGGKLFDRHIDAVYAFFSRKVPPHVVDDLVQRAFLACTEARRRFRPGSSFRAYLFSVARNTLHDHFRKLHRAGNFDASVTSLADIDPSPSQIAAQKAEQTELLDAMRHIALDLQIVLELHYWEELSTQELAVVLDIKQGTVKSRLRRAREALHSRLAENASRSKSAEPRTAAQVDAIARSLRRIRS